MIPSHLYVTRRSDDIERADGRYKTLGKYKGAFIRGLDSNPHWIGQRYMLYIPVENEKDSDGEQKYQRIEIEASKVFISDDTIEVAGFVHVNPETDDPVRFAQDDPTGFYRREWWTQRTTQ